VYPENANIIVNKQQTQNNTEEYLSTDMALIQVIGLCDPSNLSFAYPASSQSRDTQLRDSDRFHQSRRPYQFGLSPPQRRYWPHPKYLHCDRIETKPLQFAATLLTCYWQLIGTYQHIIRPYSRRPTPANTNIQNAAVLRLLVTPDDYRNRIEIYYQ